MTSENDIPDVAKLDTTIIFFVWCLDLRHILILLRPKSADDKIFECVDLLSQQYSSLVTA